jgi:hypothetical protein
MKQVLLLLFFVVGNFCHAQESFDVLKTSYSGVVLWDDKTGTVTFTSSGIINFANKALNFVDPYSGTTLNSANWIWNVPSSVKKIFINQNVTVNGGFHTKSDIIIEGADRASSVVFGTPLQSWADVNNPSKLDLEEWNYCQIQVFGGSCIIRNLKIYNPYSFAVRGWGYVIHMKKVDVIDDRGGWHNHSDGFEGGDGSSIDSCYFESGDDIIKVYFPNLKVSNTTIKMVQNTVPIQFGWGSYGSASAEFENCKIIGSYGRDGSNPIFDYKSGSDIKLVKMNNCFIENTNGTLFRCQSLGATLNIEITNSYVKVKKYEDTYNALGSRTICGSTEKISTFNCFKYENK